MNPVAELSKIADDRLDTLNMYVAMITALCFWCMIVACGFAMWTKFGGGDHAIDAILAMLGTALLAWLRHGVIQACARQKTRVEQLSALNNAQIRGDTVG